MERGKQIILDQHRQVERMHDQVDMEKREFVQRGREQLCAERATVQQDHQRRLQKLNHKAALQQAEIDREARTIEQERILAERERYRAEAETREAVQKKKALLDHQEELRRERIRMAARSRGGQATNAALLLERDRPSNTHDDLGLMISDKYERNSANSSRRSANKTGTIETGTSSSPSNQQPYLRMGGDRLRSRSPPARRSVPDMQDLPSNSTAIAAGKDPFGAMSPLSPAVSKSRRGRGFDRDYNDSRPAMRTGAARPQMAANVFRACVESSDDDSESEFEDGQLSVL